MRTAWHFKPKKNRTKNGMRIQFWCTLWPQRTHTHTHCSDHIQNHRRELSNRIPRGSSSSSSGCSVSGFDHTRDCTCIAFAAYALGQPFAGRVVWKLLVFSVLTAICCDFCFVLCLLFQWTDVQWSGRKPIPNANKHQFVQNLHYLWTISVLILFN